MFKLLSAALLYSAAFHYAYVEYIFPSFEYAHYYYIERSSLLIILTYFLSVMPVAAYRSVSAPASFGVVMILVLCYMPAQLVLLFTLDRPLEDLVIAQVMLALSMTTLFLGSSLGKGGVVQEQSMQEISSVIGFLTLISLALVAFYYRDHMRLVSFEDVYDLRFETNELVNSTIANYLLSWLSYCFLPFYFAKGIVRKNLKDIGIGTIGCLSIYMSTGSKAAILTPLIVYSLHLIIGNGRDFLFRLLIAMTFAIVFLTVFTPDEGPFMWAKSILLVRILGTGGWTISTYYDFFSTNGFTFYTHIGPINALTGAYPYGEYSLGQVIGLEYSGSAEANFNANFWASDGLAALGVLGIPVVTIVMIGVLYGINRTAKGHSSHFVVLWLSGFWLGILNLPLTTALLSGGGGLTMLLLWNASRVRTGTPVKTW